MTLTKPPAAARPSVQGTYAGAVSRFAAYAVDVLLSGALFMAGLAATVFAIKIITLHTLTWTRRSPFVDAGYFIAVRYDWDARTARIRYLARK
jgi:hypothetical protein